MEKLKSGTVLDAGSCLFGTADEFFKLKNWLESIDIIISGQPRAIGEMGDKVSEIFNKLNEKYGKVVDVSGIDSIKETFLNQYNQSLKSDKPNTPANYADAYNTFVDFSKLVKKSIEKVKKSDYFNKLKEKGEDVMIKSKESSGKESGAFLSESECEKNVRSKIATLNDDFLAIGLDTLSGLDKKGESVEDIVGSITDELINNYEDNIDYDSLSDAAEDVEGEVEGARNFKDVYTSFEKWFEIVKTSIKMIKKSKALSSGNRYEYHRFIGAVWEKLSTLDEQFKEIGLGVISKNKELDLGYVVVEAYKGLSRYLEGSADKDLKDAAEKFSDEWYKVEGDYDGAYDSAYEAFENFYNMAVKDVEKIKNSGASSGFLARDLFDQKVRKELLELDEQFKEIGVDGIPKNIKLGFGYLAKEAYKGLSRYLEGSADKALKDAAENFSNEWDDAEDNYSSAYEAFEIFYDMAVKDVKKIKNSRASSGGDGEESEASSSGEDKKPGDFLSKDKFEEIIKKALLALDERFKEIGLDVISQGINSSIGLGSVVSRTYDELLRKFGEHVDKDLDSAKDEFVDKFRETEQGDTEGNYRSALEAFKNFYNISAKNVGEIRWSDYFKESQGKAAGGLSEEEFLNEVGLKSLSLRRDASRIGLKVSLNKPKPTSVEDVSDLVSDIYKGLEDKYSKVIGAPLGVLGASVDDFNEKVRSSHDGNFKPVYEAFDRLYGVITRVIKGVINSGEYEKLQKAEENKNNPYFTEVLSMYSKLVKRARMVFKDLKTESPTSLEGVREATENLCGKIRANGIEISQYEENSKVVENSIDAYNKNPNEDNGKEVIESYKKLYGSIFSALDGVFDSSLTIGNGRNPKEYLYKKIYPYLKELQKEVVPVIGQVQYRNPETYRKAADMIKDTYEKVIEKTGAQRNEAVIKSLSDKLDSYYEGSISSEELSYAIYELKDVITKTIRSMPKAPAKPKSKPPVRPTQQVGVPRPASAPPATGRPQVEQAQPTAHRALPNRKPPVRPTQQAGVPRPASAPPAIGEEKKKKSDKVVQKALEGIFRSSIVKYFSQSGGDGAVKNFNGVYKEFKAVKSTCPVWYQFMKSVFSAGVVPAELATNNTLIGILLASCCAADSIAISDAVCRSIRIVTKELKEEYIVKAENMRKGLKTMINKVDNPEGLDKFVEGGLKLRLGLLPSVVTPIFNKIKAARSKK